MSAFSVWKWKILAQAYFNNISASHGSFCCHGLFKAHLAWGKVLEIFEALYWLVKNTGSVRGVSTYLIGRRCCQSSLHSLLSTSPSLHRLDVRPNRGFWRKHPPQTAYQCQRDGVLRRTGTRRYGSNGVTAAYMAVLKLDNGVWPWTETLEALNRFNGNECGITC